MKAKVYDISELTDSRELLESKPHPFVSLFITLLLLIIGAALTWSYFGEIDIVAKASGVVRPNEKVSTIQSKVMGKVESVDFHEGKQVEAGDVLFSIQSDELNIQHENLLNELRNEEQELVNLLKFKESIRKQENLFQDSQSEGEYFQLYKKFALDYNKLQSELENNTVQLQKAFRDVQQNIQSIAIDNQKLNLTENTIELDVKNIENDQKNLEEKLEKFVLLEKAYIENKNYFEENPEQEFFNIYTDYENTLMQLKSSTETKRKKYETSKKLGEKYIPKAQIDQEKKAYEAAQLEVEGYKNNKLLEVRNRIKNYEEQLQELAKNKEQLIKGNTLEVEKQSINNMKAMLEEKRNIMKEEVNKSEQYEQMTLEKFRTDKIVEINERIKSKQKLVDTLKENIKTLQIQLDDRKIKSPINGVVNVAVELNKGDIVQPGREILTVVPKTQSKYKVQLSVLNKDINKLEIGDKVKYQFLALPFKEYGELAGEITKISTDATIDPNSGVSFYKVEATIKNAPLYSYKGEKAEIKVGMVSEAYVVSETKKIIYYVFEKINLKE